MDFRNIDNNSIALDTLDGYSDYILGEFDGKFLVTTNVYTRSYFASTVSLPLDSSYIQYQLGYKLLNENIYKGIFVSFGFLEPLDNLNDNYRYNSFGDFIEFFNRNEFVYRQDNKPYPQIHNMQINYFDYNSTDESIDYSTINYDGIINSDNYYFIIDNVSIINDSIQAVQVDYSFQCDAYTYLNTEFDEIKIRNGKGRATFEYVQ